MEKDRNICRRHTQKMEISRWEFLFLGGALPAMFFLYIFIKNMQNKMKGVQWTYVNFAKTPQNVVISLSSHIRSIFEGAYKPNSRIFAISGMYFDGIVSGCLHWIFQWSHRKAYKIKQLCVTYMYLRRINLKKEKPRISVSISYTLLLRITRLTQYSLLVVPFWWMISSITLIKYPYFCLPDFTQRA